MSCSGPPSSGSRLQLKLITLAEAKAFIATHHRTHQPPRGHKFSVGARIQETTALVGVAVIGRPVNRYYDDGETLEVTRVCTDGTPNANSFLYGAAWRAAKAIGALRAITYIHEGESGASLRAAGWRLVRTLPPREGWSTPSRPRSHTHPTRIGRALWLIGQDFPQHSKPAGKQDDLSAMRPKDHLIVGAPRSTSRALPSVRTCARGRTGAHE